jgi:hypothetical protein
VQRRRRRRRRRRRLWLCCQPVHAYTHAICLLSVGTLLFSPRGGAHVLFVVV